MNNIICKYVNATKVSKTNFARSSRRYIQTTELKPISYDKVKDLNNSHLNKPEEFEKELNSSTYPERDWAPWKFTKCPKNYWYDINNVQNYMNWASKQLNVKEMDDWYKVSYKDFINIGGQALLNINNNSHSQIIMNLYPEHNWLPWKFINTPKFYWEDVNNQKKFVKWAETQLNIKEMEDWYHISQKEFTELGGETLLTKKYKSSLYLLLSSIYPDHNWQEWKFNNKGRWDDIKNQREFLDWVAKKRDHKEKADWYNITTKELMDFGGKTILAKYNFSPAHMLMDVYSEFEWLPWKFSSTPANFLSSSVVNKRLFMDWAGKQLNIKDKSDWYNIQLKQLIELGGKPVCDFTLVQLLEDSYPEFSWEPYKFSQISQLQWESVLKDKEKRLNYVKYLEEKLGIENPEQWESVSYIALRKVKMPRTWGVANMIEFVNEVRNLKILEKRHTQSRKSQHALKSVLQQVFPKEEVLEEYRHPELITASGRQLELDFYYPKLNIAFEYQGRQHYARQLQYLTNQRSLEESQQIDISKHDLCKEKGITLIEVPFWWNKKHHNIAVSIYNQRPDLFVYKPFGNPIPLSAPHSSSALKDINKKNELMTATEWEKSMNPTGWYLSEKYDGMRFYWDGSDFYSRHGNKINVPETIKSNMPKNVTLDGELWTQYGLYQSAVQLCLTKDENKWANAKFWVFDAPYLASHPYEERVEQLKKLKEDDMLPSFVNIIEPIKCNSEEHLQEFFQSIISKGGEGVVLREPNSIYRAGRSTSLRKYKPFMDTEVRVIRNDYPHGFHCVQLNGKRLFVGLSDNYGEAKKVTRDTVITVKHLGTNVHGTLQYPKFYRIRTDVKWKDLVNNNSV